MEKKTEVMLMYRQNDLFEKYMPSIKDEIEKAGYSIVEKVFPVGTPEEEIEPWKEKALNESSKKIILADGTCSHNFLSRGGILDKVFHDSATLNLFSEELLKGIDNPTGKYFDTCNPLLTYLGENINSLENSRETYSSAFKQIFKDRMPEEIYLFRDCLCSHEPFYQFSKEDQANKFNEEDASEILKKSLVDAGALEDKIYVHNFGEVDLYGIDRFENCLIADRHAGIRSNPNLEDITKATILKLPLENLYESAVNCGLIEPKENNEEQIRKTIRFYLGK